MNFFEKIFKDLYQSVYVALGGSLEDQTFDWANRGLHFASVFLKILILLVIIGFWYWLFVYIAKHTRRLLHLNDNHIRMIRTTLWYLWLVCSILAIMSQVGVATQTLRAFAKASFWAGLCYVFWSMSAQISHWLLHQYNINESIEQLFRNLLSVIFVLFGTAMILTQFGFNLISLVTGLGIVGVAVGFAAQSTLANFIAGITILAEQSFRVGDWIRIGTQEGRVVEITLRTTHILDRDNVTVVIPNATVASSEVVNLTAKTFVRFDVPVRTALNSDIDEVRALILAVLKQNEVFLTHPLPSVTLNKIGEYDLQFIVRFWVNPSAVARLPLIKEQLIETIKKELDSQGLATPYPHLQLLTKDEPSPHKSEKTAPKPTSTQSYLDSHTQGAQSFPDGS